jgi:hypothetical protein
MVLQSTYYTDARHAVFNGVARDQYNQFNLFCKGSDFR